MARRQLLTHEERQALFGFPVDPDGLIRCFTLSRFDRELVAERGVGALPDGGRDGPNPSCYAVTGWRPTEYGRPATNIRFSTATPMAASVCWPAKPRARSRGPISVLYRPIVVSTKDR